MSSAWASAFSKFSASVKAVPTGVRLGLTVVSFMPVGARLYSAWNPQDYMRWYLRHVAAGNFVMQPSDPKKPWVSMEALRREVSGALKMERSAGEEQMLLVSGLQVIGKTQGTLRCCAEEGRRGFFLDFGRYARGVDEDKVNSYVISAMLTNGRVRRSWFGQVLWWTLPSPQQDYGTFDAGLKMAFKGGGLTLVVDEVQVIANEKLRHSGMLNLFCQCSGFGPVVLLSSEYAIPQELEKMTHIASRTRVFYCPMATVDEMRQHIEARFGTKHAELVLRKLQGSFRLLKWLDGQPLPEGLMNVRQKLRADLKHKLGLESGVLMLPGRAETTAKAMLAATLLAFGPAPEALDPVVLELASAHGAKIDGGDMPKASFATPLTGEVLTEMVCDKAVRDLMTEYLEGKKIMLKFDDAIKGKCTR